MDLKIASRGQCSHFFIDRSTAERLELRVRRCVDGTRARVARTQHQQEPVRGTPMTIDLMQTYKYLWCEGGKY